MGLLDLIDEEKEEILGIIVKKVLGL